MSLGGLERAGSRSCRSAVIAATGGGGSSITQSLITIDMTTILSLLYLAFAATILGYGIWARYWDQEERLARGAVIIAGKAGSRLASAAVLLGETLTGTAATCGRSTDYGWTLYQYVLISCALYCASGMRHYVTKKTNANFCDHAAR